MQYFTHVVDADLWSRQMSYDQGIDLSARITALDLLTSIYVKCSSVLGQHEAIIGRQQTYSDPNNMPETSESESTTVLLKPLLYDVHLKQLEKDRIFEASIAIINRCGHAVWQGVSGSWCAEEHQRLSRLLVLLHSRRPNEPSSDIENIIVAALTSNDQARFFMVNTDAARTFHRVWTLTRTGEDQQLPLPLKAFNRAVMLLLGVLADESVSRARTELKSAAAAWFVDCAKHNDLPRIVQMLSTMLMNPVTARISIQYVRQEVRLARDQFPSMPVGVSAVTLVTSDGKQRLYHIDGPSSDGSWHSELRNRLLLSSEEEKPSAEPPSASACTVSACDIPNFDDDTDSLDTLSISLEGIDPGVVETLQFIIDCIIDEEESELDARRRFAETLDRVAPVGEAVVFRNDSESEIEISATSCDGMRTETSERTGSLINDSLNRAFDPTDLLRPSMEVVSEGASLFHELHVHMLLYGESGRVVDLGRAETAFRILTALLSPRIAPVSNRMLLSCLVSSGTASQTGESGTPLSGSLVDLMAKHVRAILGQHFWGVTDEEDVTKHRHLTLLELLLTISLHFLRSFFLNSPVSPVTEADLIIAWKCKIAALDFLSELIGELSSMLGEQQSRAFVLFIQSILTRSKLQKCLLHLLLTAVHDPRTNAEPGQRFSYILYYNHISYHYSLPLSVSIFEFNEGTNSDLGRRLSGLLSAYNRSLLALTAQTIRLESDIKSGYHTFGDQNASGIMLNRLAVSQQLYNTPAHRGTIREPNPSLVELRAFLLIVLNALKKRPERHDMWLQFVIQILPWMERSLATVVVRVVEQLCKNLETAMSVCFESATREMIGIDQGAKEDAMEGFPANFLTMTLETLTALVHFCVVNTCPTGSSTIQTGAAQPTSSSTASSGGTSMVGQVRSFIKLSQVLIIPGTRGATELFSNLVKVFSFSDSSSQLRRLVLDLLSPIAQHHQHAFLTALSLVWLTRCASGVPTQRKSDPDQTTFPTEAPLLELVHACVRALPAAQLRLCWPSLQALIADVPLANLPPRAVFLLFITPLNTPLPSSMNSSEQSSLRDSTLSLINRPSSLDTGTNVSSLPEKKSSSNLRGSVKDPNNNKRDPAHSTQALFLLAENLAELIDSVCKSDDKERLLPTLHTVWGNVVPYLKAKNARNARFFLASSQLLASMSSFNYMRPVWKKTTLELLLDSSFFKMDMHSLRQWLTVTDHLMTHDKTSFKDLLKSIAYTPNASFSIMTSKEQEYEARAQAVKRLAFVVLGSELDQYQAQMNDIQERLSENLRVSQSPAIRSAVFLCIRVLLLRLRPPSLVGIWPIMVTELVHVLLQMEQQLCSEGNGVEDLACARDDAWMQLYLAACKLLETLCTLPAGYLAQFQMFVGIILILHCSLFCYLIVCRLLLSLEVFPMTQLLFLSPREQDLLLMVNSKHQLDHHVLKHLIDIVLLLHRLAEPQGQGGTKRNGRGGVMRDRVSLYSITSFIEQYLAINNFSCEALEKAEGKNGRPDWRKERETNQETFGHSAVRSLNYRRGYGQRGRGVRGAAQGYNYNRGGSYSGGYNSYRNNGYNNAGQNNYRGRGYNRGGFQQSQ
uniref:TFG domain-containing protein n=1 Tax=Heterorhabditis bacteriophora TaxID=37862 RepID=A0A1I7XQM3_HETBA